MRKKIISIIMLLICCFCCSACGSSKNLTYKEIFNQLSTDGVLEGTLVLEEGTNSNVTAFNYTVTDINTNVLLDKTLMREGLVKMVIKNDFNTVRLDVIQASSAWLAVAQVVFLFNGEEEVLAVDFIEEVLVIIWDDVTVNYNGWSIFVTINQSADSVTIWVSKD